MMRCLPLVAAALVSAAPASAQSFTTSCETMRAHMQALAEYRLLAAEANLSVVQARARLGERRDLERAILDQAVERMADLLDFPLTSFDSAWAEQCG